MNASEPLTLILTTLKHIISVSQIVIYRFLSCFIWTRQCHLPHIYFLKVEQNRRRKTLDGQVIIQLQVLKSWTKSWHENNPTINHKYFTIRINTHSHYLDIFPHCQTDLELVMNSKVLWWGWVKEKILVMY